MVLGYEIETVGLEEQIALLEREPFISERELLKAMEQSTATLEANIKPLTPIDRGRLRGSIGSEISNEGLLNIVGRVGPSLADEVYPQVMEFGRAPGTFPPIEPLQAWVHRVIQPPEHEERSIAYLIARKIFKNGIAPREYMKKGWEKSQSSITRFFTQAVERIAESLSNGRE